MKKLMVSMVCGAALAGLVGGCATTAVDEDPVAQWQNERYAADEIAALQKQNKLPGVGDIAVKSTMSIPAGAAIINTFDIPFATIYAQVIKGVDKDYANFKGYIIYQNVVDAVTDNKSTIDAEVAKLSPENKKVFDDFVAYSKGLKAEDLASTLKWLGDTLVVVAAGTQQVGDLAAKVKACPEFSALAGLAAVTEAKNLSTDIDNLKSQLASTTDGLNLWKTVVECSKAAQEYQVQR